MPSEPLGFLELHRRLVAALQNRINNGEWSERQLARLAGISQPHVHNVLKGKKLFSPATADLVLHRLGINVLDLLGGRLAEPWSSTASAGEERWTGVPVLDGWVGPGFPMPVSAGGRDRFPFPRLLVAPLEDPAVVRLAQDGRMRGLFRENDIALLDRSPARRARLEAEALYVVCRRGEGLVRRVRLDGDALLLAAGVPGGSQEPYEVLMLARRSLLDAVRARVVWLGVSLTGR